MVLVRAFGIREGSLGAADEVDLGTLALGIRTDDDEDDGRGAFILGSEVGLGADPLGKWRGAPIGIALGADRGTFGSFGPRDKVFDALAAAVCGKRPAMAPRVATTPVDLPADVAAVRAAPRATAADSGDVSDAPSSSVRDPSGC